MDYLVVWEMEIRNAATPEEAALRARAHEKDEEAEEPVVDVYSEEGECTRVDLEELRQEESTERH
ncbi:MAG: hypothetical protein P4K93_15770 [Terracidiphilus sp.]|nr:hypothetical protein [Terracidiphilus sp.]